MTVDTIHDHAVSFRKQKIRLPTQLQWKFLSLDHLGFSQLVNFALNWLVFFVLWGFSSFSVYFGDFLLFDVQDFYFNLFWWGILWVGRVGFWEGFYQSFLVFSVSFHLATFLVDLYFWFLKTALGDFRFKPHLKSVFCCLFLGSCFVVISESPRLCTETNLLPQIYLWLILRALKLFDLLKSKWTSWFVFHAPSLLIKCSIFEVRSILAIMVFSGISIVSIQRIIWYMISIFRRLSSSAQSTVSFIFSQRSDESTAVELEPFQLSHVLRSSVLSHCLEEGVQHRIVVHSSIESLETYMIYACQRKHQGEHRMSPTVETR